MRPFSVRILPEMGENEPPARPMGRLITELLVVAPIMPPVDSETVVDVSANVPETKLKFNVPLITIPALAPVPEVEKVGSQIFRKAFILEYVNGAASIDC